MSAPKSRLVRLPWLPDFLRDVAMRQKEKCGYTTHVRDWELARMVVGAGGMTPIWHDLSGYPQQSSPFRRLLRVLCDAPRSAGGADLTQVITCAKVARSAFALDFLYSKVPLLALADACEEAGGDLIWDGAQIRRRVLFLSEQPVEVLRELGM